MMQATIRSAHEAPEDAVVTRVDPVESLLFDAPNPRAEAPAEHRERGKVDVGVAVGVGVVLLEREVALVVEEAVQDGGRVPIRALDGRAEERGVVVGDETVELEGEVAEPRTVGLLKDLPLQRVPTRWKRIIGSGDEVAAPSALRARRQPCAPFSSWLGSIFQSSFQRWGRGHTRSFVRTNSSRSSNIMVGMCRPQKACS